MSLVPHHEVEAFLEAHPGWTLKGKEIVRTYVFKNFSESMGFVTRVGLESEKSDHHPDIDIRWNKVTLALSTHSEGGLTASDLELADNADHIT